MSITFLVEMSLIVGEFIINNPFPLPAGQGDGSLF
jgi:hypothetical protein